jgi:hypothetical protein
MANQIEYLQKERKKKGSWEAPHLINKTNKNEGSFTLMFFIHILKHIQLWI